MTCSQRCNRRILLEDRVSLGGMASLDVLSSRGFQQVRLDELSRELGIASQPGIDAYDAYDTFLICMTRLFARGELKLYVADPQRTHGYRIRPDVMQDMCRCWSLVDSICEGRFVTKTALMCHGSIEVQLSGQPLYTSVPEFNRACRIRPIAKARLREIIKSTIDNALADGRILTKAQLLQQVFQHPDVRNVSGREVHKHRLDFWPVEWKRPGPRQNMRSRPRAVTF